MIFIETKLRGSYIIDVEPHGDDRGFFARTFCQQEFADHGLSPVIAQGNIAYNARRGTLRGMHFQYPPFAEAKLVRCTRGAILDIIVDIRPNSETFLQHVAVELSAENHRSLYVPEGFAHGYQALVDETETSYQMSEFYAPESEGGLHHADADLGLRWPLPVAEISPKDASWPRLRDSEGELRSRMAGHFMPSRIS